MGAKSDKRKTTEQDSSASYEVVLGLVGPVGTDWRFVQQALKDGLNLHGYETEEISISADIIPQVLGKFPTHFKKEYNRIRRMMDLGNEARLYAEDHSVLAIATAAKINYLATDKSGERVPRPKTAYVIRSLKHEKEVEQLRTIYGQGFFLIGVHSSEGKRLESLMKKDMTKGEAKKLMQRDELEGKKYGQRTREAFHLADFFLDIEETDYFERSLWRILDLLFGDPFITPTFDEYAMFMAFAGALKSADLSRQVGAVITRKNEILSTGSNDCPRRGGGQYWPRYNEATKAWEDEPLGRDHMIGKDMNFTEKMEIVSEIGASISRLLKLNAKQKTDVDDLLKDSRIMDVTEYGRSVHAEMDALLACAREGISTRDAELYCTTFPCHNCAKHIVAAGIRRVVFVEPYAKSKALKLHADAIRLKGLIDEINGQSDLVIFEPFVGVGPRRFFDLFSLSLSSGYENVRKNRISGEKRLWQRKKDSRLRTALRPASYIQREQESVAELKDRIERVKRAKSSA